MSEEIKNIEKETENTKDVPVYDVPVYEPEPETSDNGISGGLVVFAAGVLAAVGYGVYKKLKPEDENAKAEKKRLKDEKAAEKLRKKGYLVYKADEVEVREYEDADGFEDIDEAEEEK